MTAMEEEKIDFVVRIKREQEKKSVRQRIASVSDRRKKCLKQCVVAFIGFCVTCFFGKTRKFGTVGRQETEKKEGMA